MVYDQAPFLPPTPMVAAPADRARLVLTVPADAVVRLNGQRMTVTGTERKYLVPQVEPGKAYRYTVQVDVTRDGRTLSATAEPRIAAGAEVNLVFQEAVDRPQVVTTRD
jgi:uncharacterized protein (TIGR03000 family)